MGQQILIVEDEDPIRQFMSDVLRDLEFDILEAATAEEALQLLSDFKSIAVIIADIELAGEMTGLELVQRARDAYPGIRSFVVSGRCTAISACTAGANGFLPKPFTGEMLTGIVTAGVLHLKN